LLSSLSFFWLFLCFKFAGVKDTNLKKKEG
jgi:hypothetical protein